MVDEIDIKKPNFTSQLQVQLTPFAINIKQCVQNTHFQDAIGLRDGQSVHLQCSYLPVADPDLTVDWTFNGKPIQNSSRLKTIADFGFASLDIVGIDSRDSGSYQCHIKNK